MLDIPRWKEIVVCLHFVNVQKREQKSGQEFKYPIEHQMQFVVVVLLDIKFGFQVIFFALYLNAP